MGLSGAGQTADRFHQQDAADARLGLLAAFDGLVLASAITMSTGRQPDASMRQLEKKFEDGLSQAVRWLTPSGQESSVSLRLVPGLIEDAQSFLIHAADYSNLADFHRLYGAKMVLAEVDQENRRIRFSYSSREREFEAGMGFISSIGHELVRLRGETAKRAKIKPVGYDLQNGMVRLRNPELLATNDPAFELPLPPKIIADDADLDGFSMAEFTAFWRGLVHWSTHCLVIYLRLALSGRSQESCTPTQVVPLDQFRGAIMKLSGLSPEKVARISTLVGRCCHPAAVAARQSQGCR